MKKTFKILITIAIIGVLIVLAVNFPKEKVTFNEGYVNGNTSSNLYNGGLFCESNGTIFFANPNDADKLYSMDSNGQNLVKLSNDTVTYINADDNYVYYVRNNVGDNLNYSFFSFHRNALCRMPREGGEVTILDTDPSMYASLIGNYIYYIHYDSEDASTLYKVRIDGEERKQLSPEAVYTCNADGQYFYYNGMSTDGSIHRFDTANDTSTVIYEANCYQPVVNGGTDVYYLDASRDNALVHTNLQFNNPVVLTNDSIDSYNVYGSYIYYQKYDKDGSSLCMIKNDGTEAMEIKKGDFCDIHVTSYYVFFREYHSKDMYYFLRTNPYEVMRFSPATMEKK